MAHGIEIVVCHHLWLTAGTRGEVHQHRVVVVVDESGTHEFRSLLPFCLPVMESFWDGLAVIGDGNILFYRGTLWHCQLYLTDHIGIVHTDDSFHRGTGIAIDDIMLCQHMGSRNHDGTDLTEGQHDDPPLIASLQDQHHRIVLANAKCLQVAGSLVGLLLQLSVGRTDLLSLIVGPEDGQLLRGLLSPRIHHIVGEIEILRNDKLQVLIVIFYRRELCLL